jgi:hypothetical protein
MYLVTGLGQPKTARYKTGQNVIENTTGQNAAENTSQTARSLLT